MALQASAPGVGRAPRGALAGHEAVGYLSGLGASRPRSHRRTIHAEDAVNNRALGATHG